MASHWRLIGLLFSLLVSSRALAEPASFDLAGPTLDVTVTHERVTLPIAAVPNLSPGDQVSIKVDLPPGQSVHYLLVAAFLRGATNPPPEKWFHRSETWSLKARDGLKITVPQDAQQVMVFLAPQTGGDFKTLVDAVRGRPGAFVRASQDLNQLALDRSRLDAYLAGINRIGETDPDQLKVLSPLLARSLAIKLNPDCLEKTPELQAPCLMQGQDALVLNDGHSTSMVEAVTSGASADLLLQLGDAPQAGSGYYGPYIGAVMDIARIMDSFQTAHYQYIPALAIAHEDHLGLVLNTPPSFHNPMSVLVAALPAVGPPQPPPLRPVDPKQTYCAQRPDLVLPIEGAPLTFSTAYARDMVLRLKKKDGGHVDIPVKASAQKGGLVADTTGLDPAALGETVEGSLHGNWGFTAFDGPAFHIQKTHDQTWSLAGDDQQSLIVGREDTVHLRAPDPGCVDSIQLRDASGETAPVDWKQVQPDELALTLPLKQMQPGPVTLLIKQYGEEAVSTVPLETFAQAGHLDSFTFHAGDLSGVLKGARLDEVAGLSLRGVSFKPAAFTTAAGVDALSLVAADAQAAAKLKAGETATAKVALKDRRAVSLKVSIEPPRPVVSLISKTVQPSPLRAGNMIELTDGDEVRQGDTLTFSVHAEAPASFSGDEKIEVARADRPEAAPLTLADGLVLADPHVAVATLDTGKAFSGSDFGALRFRVVDSRGAGDWTPLATLVRLPMVRELKCPAERDRACELRGANLFLIDALSSDRGFERAVKVPDGFTGGVLAVPRPEGGRLYVKLRDAPSTINVLVSPSAERAHPANGPPAAPSRADAPGH